LKITSDAHNSPGPAGAKAEAEATSAVRRRALNIIVKVKVTKRNSKSEFVCQWIAVQYSYLELD
jgi:hypothetical protein